MNNIFKVIWNHATQTWTAVGELASAKGKSKSIKLAAISTALLVVSGVAQAEKEVVQKASNSGGLTISVVDKSKAGTAVANSVDGIAIGNNAHANQETGSVGNGHIAIGLNALATGNGSPSSSVALGANSKSTNQGSVAVGNASSATEAGTVAVGNSASATGKGSVGVGFSSVSSGFNSTAVGDGSKAASNFTTSLGSKSSAEGWSATTVGNKAKVNGQDSTGVGAGIELKGKNISSLGKGSKISSDYVSTLGSNIEVGEGRNGAVVLGYGSDAKASTTVTQEDKATVGGLTYSGFNGNLKNITKDLAGRFVSVGSENNERQIKHVAAGKISDKSTDAINGSQLYSVADTITTAIKNVLGEPTNGNTDGVTLSGEKGATSTFSRPVNTTIEDKDYVKPEEDAQPKTVAGALQDLNNYVNAGWKVGNNAGEKVSRITPNGQVNFKEGDNIKVEVKPDGNNKANVTYSLAKDIKVDSVTVGKDSNTTKIESDQNGLKLDDKKIQGVENGNVAEGSKEAVNGGQLHTVKEELTKQINDIKKLNNNNQSGAFDRLERKINKQGKEARAGIAGANAAAALPQVYTAGKAMVAAAAGTFKGQNALAVGYSRASDNGKVIFKLQGNANTSGDVGAGVGVGYQW
ncbi:YadA-like family protein [Haemophilus haemolyticus]|uniref:YadA-like family protein n=1 Tax=Haemophilus haemolyticus TaxID=726 RepID=UPI000E56F041|nr:YadA-like family protein [Haemophilus haemolyticus]